MQTIEAIYDGKVLHPNDPLALKPNTRVRLTIEVIQHPGGKLYLS
jgi:predicted DNA-binding antitoxin AbrB/MazE fold protein